MKWRKANEFRWEKRSSRAWLWVVEVTTVSDLWITQVILPRQALFCQGERAAVQLSFCAPAIRGRCLALTKGPTSATSRNGGASRKVRQGRKGPTDNRPEKQATEETFTRKPSPRPSRGERENRCQHVLRLKHNVGSSDGARASICSGTTQTKPRLPERPATNRCEAAEGAVIIRVEQAMKRFALLSLFEIGRAHV